MSLASQLAENMQLTKRTINNSKINIKFEMTPNGARWTQLWAHEYSSQKYQQMNLFKKTSIQKKKLSVALNNI